MVPMGREKAAAAAGGWQLVVPLKPLVRAKSRLADGAGELLRPELALAFAKDTVCAALACPAVAGVVVVTDDTLAAAELTALGARRVPDSPGAGLNAAVTHGAAAVRAVFPQAAVAALNADLPALRPAELARVLGAAAAHRRAFLADAAGTGTTLLATGPGAAPAPAFGPGSRALHRAAGAVELGLAGVGSVRQDVDTVEDLRAALRRGVGPHTARLVARTLLRMQATSSSYDPATRSGSVLLDDGTPLPFDAAAFDAGGLRLLRPGQRVRIEVAGEGAQRRITLVTLATL
jgi:2-phospho-L-lactate guanylyltransferase